MKKNNIIQTKTYNADGVIIVPLYDYKSAEYVLLEVDSSYIESVFSAKAYVKTPNGDICLLYGRGIPGQGNLRSGIYNFSKRKTIYELEETGFHYISYPLANSVSIVMKVAGDSDVIYIDIVNLLNSSKYQIAFRPKDRPQSLLKDYSHNLLSLVKNKKHKQHIKKLIEQIGIGASSIKEKISLSKINTSYKLDVTSGKVVFLKGFTINTDIEYEIENGEQSLKTYIPIEICFDLEGDKLAIKIKTGETLHLKIKSTDVAINVPSQILLSKEYKIERYGSLENSHLYAVSDLLGDYVIMGDKIWKLQSSADGKYDNSNKNETSIKISRFENINIYDVKLDNHKKFLVRPGSKAFDNRRKLGKFIIYNDSYQVYILDLDKINDLLNRNQYNHDIKTQQYVDVTEHIARPNAWPIIDSKEAREACVKSENYLRKHKIYFDGKTGDVYLFLYISNYDFITGISSICIPIYKYSANKSSNKWTKIVTLGPYRYRALIISPNKLIPLITKDIIIAGYNILLYYDFLRTWIDDTNQIDKIFVYRGEIKFRFEDDYIEIVDIVYNKRIIFPAKRNKQDFNLETVQDNKVIMRVGYRGGIKMVCNLFVLSETELVNRLGH